MVTLRRLILVHGLKRSGNHAVTNWLRHHAPLAYRNNLVPVGLYLRFGHALPPPQDLHTWLGDPARERQLARAPHAEEWVVSLEDVPLSYAGFSNIDRPLVRMLIVRDPYNVFASRIRGRRGPAPYFNFPARRGASEADLPFALDPMFVDFWEEYARECLGHTERIASKICVYFDKWFTSREYRRSIMEQCGFEFSDVGFEQVHGAGGGSSFDGTTFDGRNTEMNVLNRADDLTEEERALLDRVLDRDSVRSLAAELRTRHGMPAPG